MTTTGGYGKYGFDFRYSFPDIITWFLDERNGTGIYNAFEPYRGMSGSQLHHNDGFNNTWVQIYQEHPEEFEADQDLYAYQTFYEPAVESMEQLTGINFNDRDPALQAALFSMAIRRGYNVQSLAPIAAGISSSDSDEEILRKMYANMKALIDDERWDNELKDALAILNGEIILEGNSSSSEILKGFQGAIKIRRVTPNKDIGEVKNTGAGTITLQESTTVNMGTLGTKEKIPQSVKESMAGVSMPDGASVSYDDLRYLTIPYYDFNGVTQQGHMIVRKELADEVLLIFQELYENKYPIEKMELIDNYASGGVDNLDYNSIEDNNTSAFCYRQATGGNSLSNHALGQAIDINPLINPYVTADGQCSHDAKYVDRTQSNWTAIEKQAYIGNDTKIYEIFKKYGWTWGGDWSGIKDYQHFEKTDLNNVATIGEMTDTNETEETDTKQYTVAIAAGHNNTDNTGASYEGLVEQDMTIKVAEYVSQLFAPYSNINVVQTGSTSSNPGGVKLNDRMQLAKDQHPDLLVVIHFNASASHNANGVYVYYKEGDSTSQALSETLVKTVANAMGLEAKEAQGDKSALGRDLVSIGNSSECGFPCALTEGGFLDGSIDRAVLSTEEGLKNYAKGIVDGVLEYLQVENKGYGDATVSTSGSRGSAINSKLYDLKYVPEDVFNEYVEKNNKKALDVFTLDEDMKLITAKWSYTPEEGLKIIKNSPINYLPVLQKYTMPFEYLINWLIDCKDNDFVGKLADLAINSEFIIAIEDNVTTTKTVVDTQNREINRKTSSQYRNDREYTKRLAYGFNRYKNK